MSDEQFREDELVSAYLDGEATPAEIAEVEQNEALRARIEQLRSVRDAVAAPVAPMPAERREQMISAALAESDSENTQRREARIVPVHRRRETLLAVAAAAILLAAVVSAGLIASRGGDESADMAAAPTESADAGPAAADTAATAEAAAPMPEEEPMAEEAAMAATTTAAYVETAEEEPMAESEAAMDEAEVADEAAIAELEAAMAAAEAESAAAGAESAVEAPAEEAVDASTPSTEEEPRSADDAAPQVVDLGAFASLESFFDDIAASWSAALENGTTADSKTCSAAVHERQLELDVETGRPFIATVGAEDPLVFDGRFARRADSAAVIIYAAPPDCEIETYDLDAPDGS